MNRLLRWIPVAVLLLAMPSLINAQEDPRPYNPVAESMAKAINQELPEWRHKSVPPINPDGLDNFSPDVLIDQWSAEDGSVRVALLFHSSEAEAKSALEEFIASAKADEQLPDVAEEAYAWGGGKSIALRIGSYCVYISSIAGNKVEADKQFEQEAKLNKLFAKLVARALRGM